MDFYEIWNKVLSETEIIRPRVQHLQTFADTVVPYIFLAESSVNVGDTVVRTGEVIVEKPAILLPPNIPQFQGFDFDKESHQSDEMVNFLLIRGIQIPSLRYNNKTSALEVFEGNVQKAIGYYRQMLERQENVQTGLIVGPEEGWPFSILIYVCTQIMRNAERDIQQLMEKFRKKKKSL